MNAPRLFVEAGLAQDETIACAPAQANYLRNVLRLSAGAPVLVFNGRDGEWLARLEANGRRDAALRIAEPTRPQDGGPDLDYLFAPLKRARLDYMVQKATELGVARLRPVLTRYTVAEHINQDRMRANAIEAAEQCGILRVPGIADAAPLARVLGAWDNDRRLVFCDEAAQVADPVAVLRGVPPGPVAVLIGPEGGFSSEERELIRSQPYAWPISLGPRIMRADTAAVAALTLVNAVLGDWR